MLCVSRFTQDPRGWSSGSCHGGKMTTNSEGSRGGATDRPKAGAPGAYVLVIIGVLYLGRDIFIPLALALLLAFVLTPVVQRLVRLGLHRIPAVAFAVLLALSTVAAVSALVGTQIVELAGQLPIYQKNITDKVSNLKSDLPGSNAFARLTATIETIREELSGTRLRTEGGSLTPNTPPKTEPVVVKLAPGPTSPLDTISNVLTPLLGPAGTAGLVLIFVIFILIEREELRDRFIKIFGGGNLQLTTGALTEAATRVSRYLVVQLVINVSYGVPIGIGLWLIGLPNAMLWGVLAAALRFIPYLGPWLAALFPLAIAIGVDPGWSIFLLVAALFIGMELVSNNILEPWLYGSSTGLSSFAIIVTAIFWTTLWGIPGLFLATPLTVCVVVIGRYIPGFSFLGDLLGSDPALSAQERFYQRLVAGNVEEAVELAESEIGDGPNEEFYDKIALTALRFAEHDRETTSETRRTVSATMTEVIQEVADSLHIDYPPATVSRKVVCIGGRTELDEAAAFIIADQLRQRGIPASVLPPSAVSRAVIGEIELADGDLVCLSYLSVRPEAYARYVGRRLKRRAPNVGLIVCSWSWCPDGDSETFADRIGAEACFDSLVAVEEWITSSFLNKRPPLSPKTE